MARTKLRLKEDLRVELAARPLWEVQLKEVSASLTKRQAQVLVALLETLLNRHCGISIQLAADLIPWLSPASESAAANRTRSPAWGAVLLRLQRELQATGTPSGMGLLLHADPAYTLFRLVEPLLRFAQRRLGHTVLLSGDPEGGVDPARYQAWAKGLESALIEVAQDEQPELSLFWSERATALAARSRQAAAGSLHVPDSRLAERTAFQRTRAEASRPGDPIARLRPRQASIEHRGSAAEEGFDGIQISRGLDRITSMLHTEYLNHPAVLADRLIHTGYFAFKRFARRESVRHVYLVGLQPPVMAEHALAPFAKACWYEFAVRASHLLARSGMLRSELRWAEGDALGRVRSVNRGLGDLSERACRTEQVDGFRRHFLHELQWLPDLLSDRGGLALELPEEPDPVFAMANWLRQAWSGDQAEHRLLSFGLVHLMLFLPVSMRRRHGEEGLGVLLRNALGFAPDAGRVLHITWVPTRIDDLDGWELETVGTPMAAPRRKQVVGDAALQAATHLQQRWMHAFRKELDHG